MKICEDCFNKGKMPIEYEEDTWSSCIKPVHKCDICKQKVNVVINLKKIR
jgi:hypothetical protein